MQEEIATLRAAIANCQHRKIGPVDFYSGHIFDHSVVLVCSGIGKVNAAIASTLAIEHFNPICIINIGALGALEAHLEPGGIILSASVAYHDVDATTWGYQHGQVPRMPVDYQASHALLYLFEGLAGKLALTFYKGVGVTGDQFLASDTLLTTLKLKFPTAIGVDMEAASIAQVAHLFNIPFVSVRAVSDHANDSAIMHSNANLSKAADNIAKLILSAIPQVAISLQMEGENAALNNAENS